MNLKPATLAKYVLSAAVALLLLYFSFSDVDWSAFWKNILLCNWSLVLLSMLFGVLSYVIRSLRWRMLLKPLDPSIGFFPVFNAINISYLVNMVLPRAGEIVRCGYVAAASSKDENGKKLASFEKVLGTAVSDRIWDLVMLFLVLGSVMALMWKRFGSFFYEQIFSRLQLPGLSFAALAAAIIVICALGVWVVFLLRKRVRLFDRIASLLSGLAEGLSTTMRMKRGWLCVIYSVSIWAVYWLQSLCIVLALRKMDMDAVSSLGMSDALFLMVAGALSSLVPVPGGFGAFHYVVALALQTVYGIPFSVGVIFATLSHESQAIVQAGCGLLSYAASAIRRQES